MLKQRLLWGSILIAFIVALIWFDHLRQDNTGFTVLLFIVVLLGLYEFYHMFTNIGLVISKTLPIAMITILIVGQWLSEHLHYRCFVSFSLVFTFFLFGSTIQYLLRARDKTSPTHLNSLFISIVGFIYIYWCLSFVWGIRQEVLLGEHLFIWFLAVTKMADTLAYFGGTLLGRHLLAPAISPRKTIEGFICALIGGTLFGLLLWHIMDFSEYLKWYYMIPIGLGCTLAGQLGDLLESLIKRYCKIKDSGRFFPGLGGVLDLVDSLILSAPITYYLMKIHLYGHPY
ncbi:phosphatidate cytidylyltransferase [Planctomycetota bacterium]